MLRLALPLSVALLAIFGTGASGAATVIPVSGEIRALAFSGDALVVARQPSRGGLRLERLAAGAPAQTILSTAFDDDDDQVALASSADALAFGLQPETDGDFAPSRVLIGPAGGPLREVTTCAAGLIVAPVAVAGSRIAWREGACGEPASEPNSVGPAAIVVGGADLAAPVRRVATPPDRLPAALVLGPGDTGLLGLLAPSFFGLHTEVRAFSAAGLGATVAVDRTGLVSPIGLLADGTGVFLRSGIDDDEEDCDELFTIAPGASGRRPVALGGCVISASSIGPRTAAGPVASGDRIVAVVDASRPDSQTATIVSVRADGSDRRVLVKGGLRRPEGVAADGARVAWWHPRCSGGKEIVVPAAAEPPVTLAACRAEILTRSARVRAGRIVVRLRCPQGCTGSAVGLRFSPRTFAFGPGTHRLSIGVALGRRRSAAVRLELSVNDGPSRTASINVRR